MVRYLLLLCLAFPAGIGLRAQPEPASWQAKVAATLPLLGHRNWILIVDSAYPLQVAPGVETIETGSSQVQVLRNVLAQLDRAPHVSPNVLMDAELPFVTDQAAPGVTAYRSDIQVILRGRPVQSLPHEQILKTIEEAGQGFHVLVLKTTMTIPYTSVFLQLDCKYWGADAERQLRQSMAAGHP
ncbi:hypothetical protein [Granulicella arctica]|uniref:hypothetical protein n=1 Tax=Granulicella arctica TaxID=940613 RepID=UPI0021E080B6|nr:hypothetical protein [Granulicella arctica]